jgi:Protein of unknown function (DUF3168)
MTKNATSALQAAMVSRLKADPELNFLLGGPRIYDRVPQGAPPPYVTLAGIETHDWSTSGAVGHEHFVTLHVWSRNPSRKEAQGIVGAVGDCLDQAPLRPDGHRLVNLKTLFWTAMPEPSSEYTRGVVRLRAVTEPL